MDYYFILGRENKISQKEIESVLAGFGVGFGPSCHCKTEGRGNLSEKIALSQAPRNDLAISILADDVLEIKLNADTKKVADLINILGGTIKIFQKVASNLENIDNVLAGSPKGKIILGISNYSKSKIDSFRIALKIKKRLSKKRKVRVIAGKDNDRLSSAQSFQYKLDREGVELGFFADLSRPAPVSAACLAVGLGWAEPRRKPRRSPSPDGRAEAGGIGQLVAVQNIDERSCRDYGKPRSDARSGMTPPKLARAMVNIALGQARSMNHELRIMNESHNSEFSIHNSCLVVDPFCGSGNILIEGLVLGLDVIGSDISEKAVFDTKANLEWLLHESGIMNHESWTKTHNSEFSIHNSIFQADTTKYDYGKIDRDFIIVSEPYLGQPRKSKLELEDEEDIEDIEGLYLDFLQNLKLTADSLQLKAICIIFPLYELKNGKKLSIFEHCIDKIEKIGYTLICPPLTYGRDYQIVKREIVLLKLKSQKSKVKNQTSKSKIFS